ncbi:MAG TPA: hypothetical protein PLJ42_11315 [Chitinophagales bacterium]|jgi:hypothetical protein|nr:hypothetical protein [Chitinophagales bacterium]MBP6153880.1 hypothetical protein [Chitinophagales bacterium]HQV79212.1 hypothetical protein [Chitinophagales bacterium]HQW80012.1 hypothetical protein [Chitinophagales bacterium]HRB19366.1 hypothetical protein [Chitinophagales bacterium]
MKIKYLLPLITWIVPTVIISAIMFKLDAPLTDTQFGGFVALLVSACITYVVGIKITLKDKE